MIKKGMYYDDEDGWYMDYPDGDTAYKRFADQCVLSHEQILQAMNNTKKAACSESIKWSRMVRGSAS